MKRTITIQVAWRAPNDLRPTLCAPRCEHRHPANAGWCRLIGQHADGVRPLACRRMTDDAPKAYERAPSRPRGAPYPTRICRVCAAEFSPTRENGCSLPTRCPACRAEGALCTAVNVGRVR